MAAVPGMDFGVLSPDYVEQLFALYQDDASQVPPEWQNYFRSLQNGPSVTQAAVTPRPAQPLAAYSRLGGDGAAQ